MNVTPEQIVAAVPALAGSLPLVSVIDSGQNSLVFDFGTHITRVGRHDAARSALEREVTVLAAIGPLLPVPTPRIEIHRAGNLVVAVHEKLPGEPLMTIAHLPESQREHVATQLGTFLGALHAIPPGTIAGLGVPVEDRAYWTRWIADVRSRIYPLLDGDAADRFDTLAVAFLDAWDDTPLRLRHGDFGSGNILVADGGISGIIDFGSASIGDPASDVAGLIASYGDDFVDLVARSCPAVTEMRSRFAFYRPAFAAMEALHGLDHNDPDAFDAGLATLRG
jgi:aminoglycoside 2''-phosphotransferase